MARLWLLLCLALSLTAAERELAVLPHDTMPGTQVDVRITLIDDSELAVTFTPVPRDDGKALHLYSKDLPKTGIDFVGRPTLIEIPPGQGLRAAGELRLEPALPVHDLAGLPVYPDGPVTLRLPVQLPAGDGSPQSATLALWYMSCSDESCNRPASPRTVEIEVPTVRGGDGAADATVSAGAAELAAMHAELVNVREELTAVRTAVARLGDDSGIAWRAAHDVAEAKALIAQAHAEGRAALLDFTGPSCSNCQIMKKTVFQDQRVIDGWNAALPIEIDTDASSALALWQSERFGTSARPLYVRITSDGAFELWSTVFKPGDGETMDGFLAFLAGGGGSDGGTGEGWWQFLLLAVGGGLFTLLMPCTYPMIPLTVNFFTKQATEGRRLLPMALAYSFGIIAFFVGIGLVVSQVLQQSVTNVAGNAWVNFAIAVLFVLLGLSLLGAFFLRLPAGLQNLLGGGGGRGGYIGALLMGMTFAITAFTCTAPFAGAVLAEGVRDDSLLRPMVGMMVYASAIAVPFFVLAMMPGVLSRLPRAGSWMNEFKHIGGLVEIAAAFKFLVIADVAWAWGIFGRGNVLVLWTVLAALAGAYSIGWLRLHGDDEVRELGAGRLMLAAVWFALALWFAAGLFGALHLGVVESFFPLDAAPKLN